MTPNEVPVRTMFRLTNELLYDVSEKAFACWPYQRMPWDDYRQIQRANIECNKSRVALEQLLERLTPKPEPPKPETNGYDPDRDWRRLSIPQSEANQYSRYARYWLKPIRRKTVRQSSPTKPRRFQTTYVEEIGWLTAREAEWFDSEDDTQLNHNHRDSLAVSVDKRFDATARFTNLGEGLPQPAWRDTGREILPRQVRWLEFDD